MRYYFAYGSNLSQVQMQNRCPDSQYIGFGRLPGYQWFIYDRGYANIKPSQDDYVLGVIYHLSPEDEAKLDVYENVHKNAYAKHNLGVHTTGGLLDCLVYIDPVTSPGKPRGEYIERMNRGIKCAGLPDDYILTYIRQFVPCWNT